jgi:transposase InsO family protein
LNLPGFAGWHHIAPGKPQQNAFIEAFNRQLHDELLNMERGLVFLPNKSHKPDHQDGLPRGQHPPQSGQSR